MAALWLQSVSLLILLVVSWPGSQATAGHFLCGSALDDALYLVCGDRGFYKPRRDVDSLMGEAAASGGENEVAEFVFKDQMETMVKRSIPFNCCIQRCTILDLESFCY